MVNVLANKLLQFHEDVCSYFLILKVFQMNYLVLPHCVAYDAAWRHSRLCLTTKLHLCTSLVQSVLLYGSET